MSLLESLRVAASGLATNKMRAILTLLGIPVVYSVLDRRHFVAQEPQTDAPGPVAAEAAAG